MTVDMKDSNEDQKSSSQGSKSRKTLTIKPLQSGGKKKLGVATGGGSSSHHTASGLLSSRSPGKRGSTVVVVTKSKRGGSSQAQNSTAEGSLDDPEIKRKLDILKNASKKKRVEDEPALQENTDEQILDESSEDSELISSKQEVLEEPLEDRETTDEALEEKKKDTEEKSTVESSEKKNSDNKRNARVSEKAKSAEFSSPFRSGNKIRNLNSLGRKKNLKKESLDGISKEESLKQTAPSRAEDRFDSSKKPQDFKNQSSTPGVGYKDRGRKSFGDDEELEGNTSPKKRSNRNKSEKSENKDISIAQLLKLEEESAEETFKPRGIRSIRAFKNKGKAMPKVERGKIFRTVSIYEGITVGEIASAMSEKVGAVLKKLMVLGVMANINKSLDLETAEILVTEMGHTPSIDSSNLEESVVEEIKKDESKGYEMVKRPPIVTIMGHVDHGKTSLLDAYRESKVVEGEAGGITQHIAAYQVDYSDKQITFLDTPGHAAFTAMRLRGAMVTDIVVIIVAADDGVMEQTVEAINHAKAANVPIIVAINKIDKPESNTQKVKSQLLSYNLIPEDMGGDIMVVEISAIKKTNLDDLLDAILLQAEMINLEVPINRPAVGSVVESSMEKLHGVTTTILIKKGTLKIGDVIVAGQSLGRVKNIYNDLGKSVKSATPSMPVEVIGLNTPPMAGDECLVVENERQAREIIEYRIENEKKEKATGSSFSLESFMKGVDGQKVRKLNVLVKADVHGSMEAIAASLKQIANDEVEINIVHQAVGGITESDVTLARASGAIIVGFNVRASSGVAQIAKTNGIEIRYYSIIYQLFDDMKAAASGLLDPILREEAIGYAEIRDVFNLSKFGKVAGCYVTGGYIKRDSKLRIIRDDIVIYAGDIKALKRFKDDVKEVKSGFECGISLEKFDDIKVGDRIEAFIIHEEKRSL